MKILNYSETRANFARVLDEVTDDREPVVITRAGHEDVVLVSRDDYESMEETLYQMRSPVNAERLNRAIEQLNAGKGVVRELIEE